MLPILSQVHRLLPLTPIPQHVTIFYRKVNILETHKRIQYLREQILHLSPEEFSENIKITCSFLSELETGKTELTEPILSDICRIFHVNSEWIISGTLPVFPESTSPLDAEIEKLYFALTDADKKELHHFIQHLLKRQNP